MLRARVSRRPGLAGVVVTLACAASLVAAPSPSTPTVASAPDVRPVARTSAAPSGKAMPVGSTKKWRQVLRDDFTGKSLKKPWTTYEGQPGGDPDGWWKSSHVVVRKGMLRLKTYKENGRWVSAGVGSWNRLALAHGRVDVRFRAPYAHGVAYALLLWPAHGGWPPEIDFAEDGGGNRRTTTATLHHGAADHQIQRSVRANFRKWHTVGVRWSPGKIVYTLDGRTWATVRSSGVPRTKMVVALQTQTWGCGIAWITCPNATTPKRSSLDVDWVVAYERRT